jgi:hypothetical protein
LLFFTSFRRRYVVEPIWAANGSYLPEVDTLLHARGLADAKRGRSVPRQSPATQPNAALLCWPLARHTCSTFIMRQNVFYVSSLQSHHHHHHYLLTPLTNHMSELALSATFRSLVFAKHPKVAEISSYILPLIASLILCLSRSSCLSLSLSLSHLRAPCARSVKKQTREVRCVQRDETESTVSLPAWKQHLARHLR